MLSPAEKRKGLTPITGKPKQRRGYQHFGPNYTHLGFIVGIEPSTLKSRVRRDGMSVQEAVSTPVMSLSAAGRKGKAKQMEDRRREQTRDEVPQPANAGNR